MLQINDIFIIIGFFVSLFIFAVPKKLVESENQLPKKISVIIPVRNEVYNIRNLLSCIEKQDHDIFEVICVDDGSTDGTGGIIEEFNVRVIEAGELPSGWKGKTWACQKGAEIAKGELLLFLDADVTLKENAVSSLAAQYTRDDMCLSVQPYHTAKKPYEQFSVFFNFIQAAATGMGMPFGAKARGLFGPAIMVSKELFIKNGGYSNVKGETIEDYLLGRFYKTKNVDIRLLLGNEIICYRMYPQGIKQLVKGWAKSFSAGAAKTKWHRVLLIFLYITAMTAIPIQLTRCIAGDSIIKLALIVAAYLYYALNLYASSRKIGSFSIITCLLYPIYLIGFHIIFLYSIATVFVFKTAKWKGRNVS